MKKCILIIVAMLLMLAILQAGSVVGSDKYGKFSRYAYRDAFQTMGVEAKNTMDGEVISGLWQSFFALSSKITQPVGENLYGITYMDKDYDPVKQMGYSYFVGVQVQEKAECPEGLLCHSVPASAYAVFEHKGKIETIEETYNYIFTDWVNMSRCTPATQDIFEVYDERFSQGSDDSIVEIWVPLQVPSGE